MQPTPCPRLALQALASTLCASIFCFDASAQTQPTSILSPVVVTATRTDAVLSEVLSDITLIDRQDIENSGVTSLSDVLARVPGVSISQTGGPASTTGVFIRGAESRFTAVFVDGIRVDTQSTGGAPWEAIPLAQVDHIEVLRGPAAAIYGSDAVAGVVQIFTRQGQVGFFPALRVGVGSYKTTEVNTSLRGGEGRVDYALGLAQENSAGFNAQPSSTNPDKDGFRNRSFSARLGLKLDARQKIDLSVLDNVVKAGYDAYGSVPPTQDIAKQHLQTWGVNWSALWSDVWKTRIGVTQGSARYDSSPSLYSTRTQVNTFLLHNELKWFSGVISADVERREDQLQNDGTATPNTQRSQNAVAVGYLSQLGAHAFQVNARRDADSLFGAKSTAALIYGWALTPQWRATASTATAFRAPTLYQLYSDYGVPSLKPETSNNQELGLRWLSGPDRASVVVYQNDIHNLINYVGGAGACVNGVGPYAGCYGNTGHAKMTGTTWSAGTLLGLVKLSGSLDLMNPKNQDTGKYLARRAREQSTLALQVPWSGWALGSEVQYVGVRYDNEANTVRLAPYSLINLTAGKAISPEWRFLARANNVTNRPYQLANGYATPGMNVYVGVSWAPND